jgi:hypothetical protein
MVNKIYPVDGAVSPFDGTVEPAVGENNTVFG